MDCLYLSLILMTLQHNTNLKIHSNNISTFVNSTCYHNPKLAKIYHSGSANALTLMLGRVFQALYICTN